MHAIINYIMNQILIIMKCQLKEFMRISIRVAYHKIRMEILIVFVINLLDSFRIIGYSSTSIPHYKWLIWMD